MRALLVHPGASWATADVWRGYYKALQKAGVEIVEYALDNRIDAAGGWLSYCWKRAGKPAEKPNAADILYQAAIGTLERALRHEVDWVLFISGTYIYPDILTLLRRAGLQLAMVFTESPYDDDNQIEYAKLVDVAFTNERTSVARFREVCPESYYLAHAYDPEVHHPRPVNGEGGHDVVFVGTGFWERKEALNAVNWDGIDFGLYGCWESLGPRHPLRRFLRGKITPNDKTVDIYRHAKIGLNIHRTSTVFTKDAARLEGAESVNPRVVELAACGVFCLTDWRTELGETYPLAPTFEGSAELQTEIVSWLGATPSERAAVANQMRQAFAGWTFDARVAQMLDVLQ